MSIDLFISLFRGLDFFGINTNFSQIIGVAWKTQDATELEHAYEVFDGIEDEVRKVPAF